MTKILSAAIALVAVAAFWVAGHAVLDPKGAMTIDMGGAWSVYALLDDLWVTLLGVFGLICAVTTWRSQPLSAFLKILIGLFSIETVIFGVVLLLGQIDRWPAALNAVLVPDSLPASVAIFSILIYAVSFVPVVRSIMHIADPYFVSHTRSTLRIWPLPRWQVTNARFAKTLVVILILINQAQVGINVRLSFFSRDWFNAIQAKDEAAFWYQLIWVFTPWAFVFIAVALAEYLLQSNLVVNWRRFLTDRYMARWLDGPTHYRMAFTGINADNPDQRIAEDVNAFIAGGDISSNGIYTYTIQLITTLSSLVSFAVILWNLSNGLSGVFTIPGTSTPIPGFLFWVALIYAVIGTVITHFIGRPLVALFFLKQRFEANFRFSLARLREYGEQVALLHGEERERQAGMRRFGDIFENYIAIMDRQKKLIAFQAFYGQISPIIPYIITAPFYFLGKITLGIMSQTAGAFARVESALNFFVTYYVSLANFRAILNRLTTFEDVIRRAHLMEGNGQIPEALTATAPALTLSNLSLKLPDGRVIVAESDLSLAMHQPVLITGPSGSGKSTLFRAIAGIWPLGHGTVTVPAGARVMLLPQKPYIPIGSLRAALAYPSDERTFDDAALIAALEAVRLPNLEGRLDEEDNWNAHLSGGEQQRVAVARALLSKPDWLFLDEATAALDETSEAAIYDALARQLPGTTVVSIGHRSTLSRFHQRRIDLQPSAGGGSRPVDVPVVAAAE